MDQGVPRPPLGEGRRRPPHPPRAHHRHRHRVLALPPRPHHQEERRPAPRRVTRAWATAATPFGLRPQDSATAAHATKDQPHQARSTNTTPTRGGATSSVHGGASASGDTQESAGYTLSEAARKMDLDTWRLHIVEE